MTVVFWLQLLRTLFILHYLASCYRETLAAFHNLVALLNLTK